MKNNLYYPSLIALGTLVGAAIREAITVSTAEGLFHLAAAVFVLVAVVSAKFRRME